MPSTAALPGTRRTKEDYTAYPRRESALDYLDDEEEE